MNKKNKISFIKNNFKYVVGLLSFLFIFLLSMQNKNFIKSTLNYGDIFVKKVKISASNIPACSVKKVSSLADGSTLIVGHGYGSPNSKNKKLDNGLYKFLIKNKGKFSRIIFTGDIFKNPSTQAWDYLEKFSKELNFDYYIAPGNHDVGYGESMERSLFQ